MSETSDTPEIRPALSREEWAEYREGLLRPEVHRWLHLTRHDRGLHIGEGYGRDYSAVLVEGPEALHAVAALALDRLPDGHPAGFTWEHRAALEEAVMTWRAEAGSLDDSAAPSASEHERAKYALMLEALAKLAALLPPRENAP